MLQALSLLLVASQAPAVEPAIIDWLKSSLVPIKTVVAESGFEDLEPLGVAIGDARIVALGEATHGSHEVFQLKHRILEYLVTKHGFTSFGIEASYPGCLEINDYVLHGNGDPETVLSGQGYWVWDTEECLEMLKWMRRYNANPANAMKVSFYGIDMQNLSAAVSCALDYVGRGDAKLRATIEADLKPFLTSRTAAELGKVDERLVRRADAALNELANAFTKQSLRQAIGDDKIKDAGQAVEVALQARELYRLYLLEPSSLMTPTERVQLNSCAASAKHLLSLLDDSQHRERHWLGRIELIDALLLRYRFEPSEAQAEFKAVVESLLKRREDLLRRSSDSAATQRALDDLAKVVGLCESLASNRSPIQRITQTYFSDMTVAKWRDRCMAKNAEWLRKQGEGGRIVLWAHNMHVDKQLQPQMLGFNLRARDVGYYAIGFSLHEGSLQARATAEVEPTMPLRGFNFKPGREGYFDHTLSRAGAERFFLALDPYDPRSRAWLKQRQMMRLVGVTFNPKNDHYFTPVIPTEAFDAVIFLRNTTRAIPTKAVRERFKITNLDPTDGQL